ncbi:MAG: hypothetical protein ACYCV0_05485 [Desulfitobacteriaceae bacterium]
MYALIDNSTLTAVQRLMGEIPVKNKNTIDGDILAFETFVQTVLFYDDVFFLDDYKSEFREGREKFFKYVYPIELTDESYSTLIDETQKLTNDFIPQIQNKTFENPDLKEFFNLLKMNIVFTWDLSSSEYYLNYKLLQSHSGVDIPKYSKLSTMVFSQFFDREPISQMKSKRPIIYDSHGKVIDRNYTLIDKEGYEKEPHISKQASAFLSGLSWLDFRTTFYILAAKHIGFDLVLHPIRNAYEVNLINKFSSLHDRHANIIIDAMNDKANKALNCILSATQPTILHHRLPMFSAWVINKNSDLSGFMDVVYTLKGEKEFIQARNILKELDAVQSEKGNAKYVTDANLLISDFEKQMNVLMDRYGLSPSSMNLTSSLITAYNLSSIATALPQIPDIGFTIKKPTTLKKLQRYSGFGATYKSIISDLTSISHLGKYHDLLCAKVVYDKEAAFYDIKTEDPDFLNRKSDWKIPL